MLFFRYVTIGKTKKPININCMLNGGKIQIKELSKIEIKVSYITFFWLC